MCKEGLLFRLAKYGDYIIFGFRGWFKGII